MANQDPKKTHPNIQVPDDLSAVYANLVRISHTPSEMIFDFARILPGDKIAPVLARVLTSPLSAKLFQHALAENLAKYEAAFGEIVVPHQQSLADFLFKPPQTPDEGEE